MIVSGATRHRPYAWLNPVTHSRANSRCWLWSSPTGTCVALTNVSELPVPSPFLSSPARARAYLWTKMSAACNTGYENKPSLSFDLLSSSRGLASSLKASLLCVGLSVNDMQAERRRYLPLCHSTEISHTGVTAQYPHQLAMLFYLSCSLASSWHAHSPCHALFRTARSSPLL